VRDELEADLAPHAADSIEIESHRRTG